MKNLLMGLLLFYAISAFTQDTDKQFVKNSFYDGTSVLVPENVSTGAITELAATVRPSARQLRWQQYEMLGFVHFNLNTFTGLQWGTGHEDLSIFNPLELDAKQWVAAFKSAGIKSVILVCKHHDGFCLWPSSYRERTIAKAPWKNGKGDVVREFFDACRAEGIRTCIYYSPWDKQEPYGKVEYNDLMINELTELMTNYGNIDLVWFDGAGIDPKVSGVKMDFDWDRIYKTVRTLQPQALISGAGPDIRWVGNEGGRGRFTEWSVQGIQLEEADFSGYDCEVPAMAKTLGNINELPNYKQLTWYPARGGLPVRHQWFWRPDQTTRTLDYMVKSYFETVGQNSNVLVNLSPDDRGLVPETDVVLMEQLGKYLETMYQKNYADGAVAKSKNVHAGGYAANYLFDEDIRTCWLASESETTGEIVVDLYGEQTFNVIKLQENIADFGQRVETFEVDAWKNGSWEKIGEATTIGIRRLLRVPETTTNRIRIRITHSRKNPSLATLELYQAPKLVAGPEISRNNEGKVQIDGKGLPVKYTIDGSSPLGENANHYAGPFELPLGGKVKAIAISNNTDEWILESSENISIDPSNWKAQGGDNSKYMYDNNPETTTNFNLNKKSDRSFEIELPEETEISGFGYLPPQGAPDEPGRVETYTLFIKNNKGKWEEISTDKFGNVDNNPVERKVTFENKISVNAVKFQINTATRQQTVARIAEFYLYSN
ncbi:alpha-L-fucosidase [Prolixibacteraceae bacterium Z1-6]|uniref:alpha-L-fucosidase n=1 Tax=Draconibacterium aestuarii TaxID=2998507 RepID=A0A9X3F3Z1_9BACT|nr:alpha-L-fucosidase [Prolixibacteraceae bacterium Z1-6]